MRCVPPTAFPSSAARVWRATLSRGSRAGDTQAAIAAFEQRIERTLLAFVDSGTSALTLAIRAAMIERSGPVAIPGYGCIDVPTAVMGAGARAVPYDLDPATLAPESASVNRVLASGVRVLVVSHLFGHPVDLTSLRTQCDALGIVLVEDAAQWAGARWRGRALGGAGQFAVFSMGRGKGLVGTGGGALVGDEGTMAAVREAMQKAAHDRGNHASGGTWRSAATALAAIALARPSLYALPSAIPSLHLGEMVYHPPRPVEPIPSLTLRLLPAALRDVDQDRGRREVIARQLTAAIPEGARLSLPRVPEGAEPGYLRLAVRCERSSPLPRELGVVRPYPRTLRAQTEVAPVLDDHQDALPGSEQLGAQLITLPVHARVDTRDIARLEQWLRAPIT